MVRKLSKGCFGGQRFSDFIQVYRRLMITLHNIALCKEGITMTPEEKARIKIDQWFKEAGWQVVNRDEYEPTMTAVAVREGLLKEIRKRTTSCLSTVRQLAFLKPSVKM